MMIKADTFDEVVSTLENFRLINGKPIGNPKQEVIDFYAKKFPWMVEYDLNPSEEETDDEDYLAWRSWISKHWGRSIGKFISRKEASMRWEKCRHCPHNIGSPWIDTAEAREFSRKSLMMRRGESIEGKMCYCDLHKADISVSSFIEDTRPLSQKPKDEQQAPGCWLSEFEGP